MAPQVDRTFPLYSFLQFPLVPRVTLRVPFFPFFTLPFHFFASRQGCIFP